MTSEFKRGKQHNNPTGLDFLHGVTFCHAPVLMRLEAYRAVGGYTVSDYLLRLEDQHLWLKLYTKGYKGYCLEEPLYMMRDDRNAHLPRVPSAVVALSRERDCAHGKMGDAHQDV